MENATRGEPLKANFVKSTPKLINFMLVVSNSEHKMYIFFF